MFFLKNIPNDLINIYFDNKSKKRSLRGSFSKLCRPKLVNF